jgi:vancomycin resistance protein YoaR
MDKYDQWINELDWKTYREAANARINDNEQIVSGQNGFKLDRKEFLKRYYEYLYNKGPASVEIPMYPVYPKVDAELLASLRSKHIGYYVTYYNSNNNDRSHNIALAAKAIDSTVIFPGETFSFNQVVGIRTTGKGYRRAGVIVRGELSEGVGGGICQVSSTLFNAVDRAGLNIVKRYSHSRNVTYVPPGRDATVSWGGPDFVFENAYNQPILIRAFAGGGSMSVSLFSSDVIEFSPRKVPSMSHQLPEEINDPSPKPANGE